MTSKRVGLHTFCRIYCDGLVSLWTFSRFPFAVSFAVSRYFQAIGGIALPATTVGNRSTTRVSWNRLTKMRLPQFPARDRSSSAFSRACAVLCLLLLMFSVAHTAVGHADALAAPSLHGAGLTWTHGGEPAGPDSADACAVCVALSTMVALAVFAFGLPRAAQPRPIFHVAASGPVTGWHASLSCRPPPAV